MEAGYTYSQEVRGGVALLSLIGIEGGPQRGDQISKALTLRGGTRVLEVEIEAVETVVLDELEGAADEGLALGRVGYKAKVTVLRVSPASNGQGDFEVTMRHLEQEHLLKTAV